MLTEDNITIYQYPTDVYDANGVLVPSTPITIQIKGNIQPNRQFVYDREKFVILQETGSLILYSKTELNIGDRFVWDGKEYEIVEKDRWHGKTLSYFKYKGLL